jgi:hypothetical protein
VSNVDYSNYNSFSKGSMKRLIPIVLLIALGLFSYFAYTVVSTSNSEALKATLESRDKEIAELKKAHAEQISVLVNEKARIRDAMVILFPQQKQAIVTAFTQPEPDDWSTTQPTTKPVSK